MKRVRVVAMLVAVGLVGCDEDTFFANDTETDSGLDAGSIEGDAATGSDTGAPDLDTSSGQDGGGGSDAGTADAADVGPGPDSSDGGEDVVEDPCALIDCGRNASCVDGVCLCDDGFMDVAGECVAPDPGDPATRTVEMVCERWNADWAERATSISTGDSSTCDPGELSPEAHSDAMRRLNLYRWLAGLEPADVDWDNQAKAQQAALMMDAQGDLDHSPDESWACFTPEGREAAGSSNLGLGYRSPAATVDGYIVDNGVPSLGHRRWCLFPTLGGVGFGHVNRGSAMWVFGRGTGAEAPDFVAYPNPGPMPINALGGAWSFSRSGGINDAVVTVTRVSDGANLSNGQEFLQRNFGLDTVSFRPSEPPAAGETYEITVAASAGTWTYRTQIVSCE